MSSQREVDDQKYESILASMLSQMNQYLNQGNLEVASKIAAQTLPMVEQIWGKQSIYYALALVPISKLYDALEKTKEREEALVQSATILKSPEHEQFKDHLLMVCDQLVALYQTENRNEEAEEWVLLSYTYKKEDFAKEPNNLQLMEKFCSATLLCANIFSNSGKFKRAEVFYKEALDYYYKTSPVNYNGWQVMEWFTNNLHLQGKLDQALQEIESYQSLLKNFLKTEQKNVAANIILKTYHRASSLCFTVDKFAEAEDYANKALELIEEHKLTAPLQFYADLASLYWELGKEPEALNAEDKIKKQPPPSTFGGVFFGYNLPQSRSLYLSTLESTVKDGEEYEISIRINRTHPKRKEGDKTELAEEIERKLKTCFVEATFENGTGKEPLVVAQAVDKYQFTLKSEKVEGIDSGKWYKVLINIYENETKENKLGAHHQLVYSRPPVHKLDDSHFLN
eukprot:TRINITY_DN10453_c0_g1_i1.p1 TRINITY_DN10453_c0_g1~~TRINITY_DN10453_c0_g1_i1.p1  ORF type:complete len:498 (-),score=150.11 TRINITY_DN10453_c0_g1_i1:110-1474(-)